VSRDPPPSFKPGVVSSPSEVGDSSKPAHTSKLKGKRELKNLKSSINYEGSSCGKGKGV
jgi:hypothetical protein